MKKYRLISEEKLERIVQDRIAQEIGRDQADAERDRLDRQMEIAMLQAQINPHFLYNTLECIRGQALSAGETDIADTTQALSRLFRYSISLRNDAVPLRDELDNVRNYMKIQQYRFRDRFTLEILHDESDPQLLDGILPKLTLQPIVENAIVHGFAKKADNARIVIEIVGTHRHLNILISDNGQGMNAEMLERLRAVLRGDAAREDGPPVPGHGIAMDNVRKRLALFFGPQYGIIVNSVEGAGTDVEIHIPFKA